MRHGQGKYEHSLKQFEKLEGEKAVEDKDKHAFEFTTR